MGIKPSITGFESEKQYKAAIAKAAKPRENPFPEPPKVTPEELARKEEEKIQEMLKKTEEEFEEEAKKLDILKSFIMFKILNNNPRLEHFPGLLALFGEILLYRLQNKKNKVGFVKATINQITVGVDITEEDLKDA